MGPHPATFMVRLWLPQHLRGQCLFLFSTKRKGGISIVTGVALHRNRSLASTTPTELGWAKS